jgi:hypothetical protein
LDDCSAQVFPYNIFAYCSICRVDCKFARNKKNLTRIVFDVKVEELVEESFSVGSALRLYNEYHTEAEETQ